MGSSGVGPSIDKLPLVLMLEYLLVPRHLFAGWTVQTESCKSSCTSSTTHCCQTSPENTLQVHSVLNYWECIFIHLNMSTFIKISQCSLSFFFFLRLFSSVNITSRMLRNISLHLLAEAMRKVHCRKLF